MPKCYDNFSIFHIENIEKITDAEFRTHLSDWRSKQVLSFETCKRHIYIADQEKMDQLKLPDSSIIPIDSKVEKLSGKDAYLLLLYWCVGLLHIAKNRFSKGDIRRRWTQIRDQDSDLHSKFAPIVDRLLTDTRAIRNLIDGIQFADTPFETRIEMAQRACENCATSWNNAEETSYEHIAELSEEYEHKSKLAMQIKLGRLLHKHSNNLNGILPSDKTHQEQSRKTAYYSFVTAIEIARKKRQLDIELS